MTSNNKLSLTQTVIESTNEHDFVSPQMSVDSIHQREKQEMEAAQTYFLQQAFPTIQTLSPLCNAQAPSYTIRLDTTGSFLKPQPHMAIMKDPDGCRVAEGKFQIHGYDATIIYNAAGTSQKLALQSPQDQRFDCSINGKPHQWRPLGPSKSVFELTEEANKRVALFVYAEGMAQRTGFTMGHHMPFQERKIGEVHVMQDFLQEPTTLQQILFTAVVVVEQVKRISTGVANWAPTFKSKTYLLGRRRSRQDSAGKS